MLYAAFVIGAFGAMALMSGAMIGFLAAGNEKPFAHGLTVVGIYLLGLAVCCALVDLVVFL